MRTVLDLVGAAVALVRAISIGLLRPRRLGNWGATEGEVSSHYAGDDALGDADVRWLRAISVDAPASAVWPWLSQLGRGAGYYSFDALDNGRRPSAAHVLDLPAPAVGDRNAAIGEVVAVDVGHEIVWRTEPVPFVGATGQMVLDYKILPVGEQRCRVVTLVLAKISGRTAGLAKAIFAVMDYAMAPEQLRGLKHRAEGTLAATRTETVPCPGPGTHQRDAVVLAGAE